MNELVQEIWPNPSFNAKYCLMGSKEGNILMFLLNIKDDYLPTLVDLLFDRGYKVEKLRRETFVYYFNNELTEKVCFIAENDNDFIDMMLVLERAA